MRHSLILATLLVLVSGVSAFGQDDPVHGLQLGVYGGMTSWSLGDIEGNEFDTESGFNFGGGIGWGMSDWLGLFARTDFTTISPEDLESYNVTHIDIGIRAMPPLLGPTIRPYIELQGAIRSMSLTEQNGFEIKGSGLGGGGGLGLYFFLSQKLALNAGLIVSIGSFDELTFGDIPIPADVSANSGRLIAGLTFFP